MVALQEEEYIMSCKLVGSALRMLFGMLSRPRELPFNRFIRHMSYLILLCVEAKGRCWGGEFSPDTMCEQQPPTPWLRGSLGESCILHKF